MLSGQERSAEIIDRLAAKAVVCYRAEVITEAILFEDCSIARRSDFPYIPTRGLIFDSFAEEFPELKAQINLLSEALQTASVSRKRYPGIDFYVESFFKRLILNPWARLCLGDIFFSRVTNHSTQEFNTAIILKEETAEIIKELCLSGMNQKQILNLTDKDVIKAVLESSLSVSSRLTRGPFN